MIFSVSCVFSKPKPCTNLKLLVFRDCFNLCILPSHHYFTVKHCTELYCTFRYFPELPKTVQILKWIVGFICLWPGTKLGLVTWQLLPSKYPLFHSAWVNSPWLQMIYLRLFFVLVLYFTTNVDRYYQILANNHGYYPNQF